MDYIKPLVEWVQRLASFAIGAFLSWQNTQKEAAQNEAKQVKQTVVDKMHYDALPDADRQRVQQSMDKRRKKR